MYLLLAAVIFLLLAFIAPWAVGQWFALCAALSFIIWIMFMLNTVRRRGS